MQNQVAAAAKQKRKLSARPTSSPRSSCSAPASSGLAALSMVAKFPPKPCMGCGVPGKVCFLIMCVCCCETLYDAWRTGGENHPPEPPRCTVVWMYCFGLSFTRASGQASKPGFGSKNSNWHDVEIWNLGGTHLYSKAAQGDREGHGFRQWRHTGVWRYAEHPSRGIQHSQGRGRQ